MRQTLGRTIRAAGLLLAASLLTTAALAQSGGNEGLSPTLANIRQTHVVRLGYRESSPPFSFLDQANRPIGYSLELCEAIVDEIGVEVDDANLKIEYVKVTSDDRIPAVVQNKIDLECGSTTANAERARQVAFSPLMFVAGTKLMVPKASSIAAATDLKGKTVVVTKGTTNEQAMHNVDNKFALGLNIVAAPDHEQSYQMLVDGKADAFATDDILLYGLIVRHKSQDKFRVTGEYLSYDPYGIMFRKGEPQLTAVVERTFRKLGSNRDLIPLYNKWFVARLPTGEKLNVAISPQLEEAFMWLWVPAQGRDDATVWFSTENLVQGPVIRGVDQLRMQPAEGFHHYPRIDFEDLPAAVDPDHVDGSEAHFDGLRGLHGDRNAGLPGFSLLQQNRSGSRIEIMAPVQDASPARRQNRVEIILVQIADHARQHRRSLFGRRRRQRQLQQ
jgi:glutamate/aspartate transport system substrate-binding protein